MNSDQTEAFRVCLLAQLREVGGENSLPVPTLCTGAKLKGFATADEAMVRSALAYLGDKQLVAGLAKTLSPENKRWRITAAGIDFLAEAGI